MLRNVLQSKRAKKELQYFEKELQKINNQNAQHRGLELLSKLKKQSAIIDNSHSLISVADINNEKIREGIETLVEIRLELAKLIKDSKS